MIASLWWMRDGAGPELPPTVPGLEYTAEPNRLHFTIAGSRLHFTTEINRLHYTVPEEDRA